MAPTGPGQRGGHRQQTGIPTICQTRAMDETRAAEVMAESAAMLRKAGARFAYLHGSRASGQHRPDSDIDTAVLRQEAGASRERRRDPIWLRGVKYTFVTAIEACVDVAQHISMGASVSTSASAAMRPRSRSMVRWHPAALVGVREEDFAGSGRVRSQVG
jgi:hypothetical protein